MPWVSLETIKCYAGTFGVRAHFDSGDVLKVQFNVGGTTGATAFVDIYGYFVDASGPMGTVASGG
jgi:hypothetical protein